MARLWQSGFELNSLTNGVEWDFNLGSGLSIVTTPVRSGTYALRVNPSAANISNSYQFYASATQGVIFIRFYLRIATLPGSNTIKIFAADDGNVNETSIRLTTTGKLQLFDDYNGAQIGSDSSALSLNTWYRIEIKIDTTTLSSTSLDGRIDGASFASGTFDFSTEGTGTIEFGLGSFNNNQSPDLYFDDVAINNDSGSFQNSWPGDGKIIHLRPNAAGDSNGFLAQVGGTAGSSNNYTRVNEVTPDNATSYNGSALLNAEDLFNCDNSGIASGDTVNVVAVGVRMADLVSADTLTAFKLEIEKTSSGTKSQSSDLIPNSTTWLTNAAAVPRNYSLVTYKDPDSSNWTQTTLDSMQIGYIQDVVNVQTIAISTLWASVDYTPAATTTSTSTTSTSSSTSTTTSTTTSTSSSTSTTSTSSSTSITTSTSTSRTTSTSTTSTSSSTSITTSTSTTTSTSSSTSTTSTSSSTSITTSTTTSTSSSTSTTSTSSSTSITTSTTTSTSSSTSTTSTSSSTSTTISTSTSLTTSTSTTSTSSSTSTSTTSTSSSTSITTSSSTSSSSSSSSSTSTTSTSSSTSITTSSSSSTSTSTTSTSTTISITTSTSTTSTSSSSSSSTSSSTTITIPYLAFEVDHGDFRKV